MQKKHTAQWGNEVQGPAIPIWHMMGTWGSLLCPSLSDFELLRFLSEWSRMEVHSAISATKATSHIVTHRHTSSHIVTHRRTPSTNQHTHTHKHQKNITVGEKNTPATPRAWLSLMLATLVGFVRFSVSSGRPHSLRPVSLVGFCAASARGALDHDDWQASPLHVTGSLDNLPPIMVVYGEDRGCRLRIPTFSTLACGYVG